MSEQFFEPFTQANKSQWQTQASQDLKGEDPLKKFEWYIEPGIAVEPYYDSESAHLSVTPFQNRLVAVDDPSGDTRHWDNLQCIEVVNETHANVSALQALEGGAEGILFDITAKESVQFEPLLQHIELSHCYIGFRVSHKQQSLFSTGNNLADLNWHGTFVCTDDAIYHTLSSAFKNDKITLTLQENDADLPYTERIARLLYRTHLLAEKIIGEGMSPDRFFSTHGLSYPVGVNFFGEIAALKALRQLYFQVARAYGANTIEPEHLSLIAVSKAWVNEDYNPHANMLKATTAAMAGILGGCNALLVEPKDPTQPLMVRIARNVSTILKEESYLHLTADPAAGSYYIEALTDKLAQQAWVKFQQKTTGNS